MDRRFDKRQGDTVDPAVSPSGPGCVECEATGGWWFHLRRCAHCGHIGCTDIAADLLLADDDLAEIEAVVSRIEIRGARVRAGDTVHTPPGEWHWHAAAPDRFMTHLAIWEAPADGPETEWGEFVSDEEYSVEPREPGR